MNLSQIICDSCGKEIKSDFKLCPYCGQEIMIQESGLQPLISSTKGSTDNIIQQIIWLFPLISAILTFLSLIFPAAYSTIETPIFRVKVNAYLWIWGIGYTHKGLGVIDNNDFLTMAFIISVILMCSGILLVSISRKCSKLKYNIVHPRDLSISIGIIQIFLIILWMALLESSYPGIWATLNISFGIIGMILSGIIAIFGGIIIGKYKETFVKYTPTNKEKKQIPYDKEREKKIALIAISIFIIFIMIVFSIIVAIFL